MNENLFSSSLLIGFRIRISSASSPRTRRPLRLCVAALAIIGSVLGVAGVTTAALTQPCVGDCDGDAIVAIDELVVGVNAAQGHVPLGACRAFDCDHSGAVPIHCLMQAVNSALDGCPCPLAAGAYTLTQGHGGALFVAPFAPFPSPADTQVVADVGPAHRPECVHDVVVPFPGGFTVPTFCVPAVGFSVSFEQIGCGIGRIDSNGGADYTMTKIGDTSDASQTCDLPQADCIRGTDNSSRVDVTVGDGVADTCVAGTANLLLTIPTVVTMWLESSSGASCPANDGAYDPPHGDPNTDDVLVVRFRQIDDLTTATATSRWADLDGDGCAIAGIGPARGFSVTGDCLNVDSGTALIVDAAPVASAGPPIYDISYAMSAPYAISGPAPPLGAKCASPPPINFHGTATRCVTEP
jgi:hypothetical protein